MIHVIGHVDRPEGVLDGLDLRGELRIRGDLESDRMKGIRTDRFRDLLKSVQLSFLAVPRTGLGIFHAVLLQNRQCFRLV